MKWDAMFTKWDIMCTEMGQEVHEVGHLLLTCPIKSAIIVSK